MTDPAGSSGRGKIAAPQAPQWADEEALIGGLFAPLAAALPGAFDLKDDAAFLAPPAGEGFIVSTDGIVAGLHLPETADAADVAWKALAVNVSDVVAKGGRPLAYVMNLWLTDLTGDAWLTRFAEGLTAAGRHFGVALAGGDTDRIRPAADNCASRPAFAVTITMFATAPADRFVSRGGARPGEKVVVTGPIGSAGLGLALDLDLQDTQAWPITAEAKDELRAAYRRPTPHTAVAGPLSHYASAAIDISDGLIKDADRLRRISGVGMALKAQDVPLLPAAGDLVSSGCVRLESLFTAGEDYVVLATIPEDRLTALMSDFDRAGLSASVIGETTADPVAFAVSDTNGQPMEFGRRGWDHVAGAISTD